MIEDENLSETTHADEKASRKGTVIQIIACLIANTSVIGPAMSLGYSAVALGPLGANDSDIKVSVDELSWIASITAIATPVGCILSSVSMRRGRRFAMITTSIASAIGWFIIYFSHDVNHILTGRAICGIAMGLSSVPTTVYAAEISSPKLRGVVVTWTSCSVSLGVLIVYVFGYAFQKNWRLVSLLCGFFPIISIILVSLKMPESPSWLRSQGRESEADLIKDNLNGISEDKKSREDYLNLRELRSEKLGNNDEDLQQQSSSSSSSSPSSAMENGCETDVPTADKNDEYKSRGPVFKMSNFKPLLIMLCYFFFQQFSGIFVVIYYAVDFTLEAGVRIDGHLAAILIGLTRLLTTVLVSYVSRKYGRRIPSIVSGIGMTIFMGILSFYLWLTISRGYEINDYGIIPVFSLTMYILTSTIGFLAMPFAMIGEIFPSKLKDLFSGLTTCSAYVFSFVILKIYPDMLIHFNKHGVFLFYAIISFAGTIFVYLFLPETKGKTLNEIEQLFVKKNNNDKNDRNKKNIVYRLDNDKNDRNDEEELESEEELTKEDTQNDENFILNGTNNKNQIKITIVEKIL